MSIRLWDKFAGIAPFIQGKLFDAYLLCSFFLDFFPCLNFCFASWGLWQKSAKFTRNSFKLECTLKTLKFVSDSHWIANVKYISDWIRALAATMSIINERTHFFTSRNTTCASKSGAQAFFFARRRRDLQKLTDATPGCLVLCKGIYGIP